MAYFLLSNAVSAAAKYAADNMADVACQTTVHEAFTAAYEAAVALLDDKTQADEVYAAAQQALDEAAANLSASITLYGNLGRVVNNVATLEGDDADLAEIIENKLNALKEAWAAGTYTTLEGVAEAKADVEKAVEDYLNAQIKAGDDLTNLIGDADTTSSRLLSIYTEAQDEAITSDCSTVTIDGAEKYVPNGMAAGGFFFDKDLYKNTLVFKVEEGAERTVVGLRKATTLAGDWVLFRSWSLDYVGTTESQEVSTAVESLAAPTEGHKAIYTIDGKQVSHLQRGLNIIKDADGKVHKVIK